MADAAENVTNLPVPVLEAFKTHEHFAKCMLDAFVVVDMSGKIHKCNQLFAQLVGEKPRQILKTGAFDDLLKLSVSGQVLKIREIIESSAPTRFDEVSGVALQGTALNLIIGVYPFVQNGKAVGAFVLIRDVTAETNLQDKYKDKAAQSITDALTGLFNRAYFVDYMSSQLATLETLPENAPQRTMSVVMFDIDFFKKINDVHGHQAGDYVIKNTAAVLKKMFRKTDIVARYGGEEFLAILPGTDGLGATMAADKVRQAIAALKFEFANKVIPVTISSGVAEIKIAFETGNEAIARADAALYYSKQNGRNRVSFHDGNQCVAPTMAIPPRG